MADSTLQAIRTKIRRLTRSPSSAQITDAQIDEYINTFVLYDFPEHLRLFSFRTVLTFYTQPFVDTYTTSTDVNNPLFNFKNKYIAIHPPVYIAGVQSYFTQYRDQFYGYWPQTNTIADTQLRGDGVATAFNGTVTAHPMIQNNVMFNSVDAAGNSMVLVDYPTSNETGLLGLPESTAPLSGTINYVTGVFTLTFPNPPVALAPVYVTNIAYQPGKPIAMLYYDDVFTVRPVPDKSYIISVEADIRPTELLASNQQPQKEQMWQYIAFMASKKIFEDRMDMDSVGLIMPACKEQERLVLRTSLVQEANQRTATIYTQGKVFGYGFFGQTGWPY